MRSNTATGTESSFRKINLVPANDGPDPMPVGLASLLAQMPVARQLIQKWVQKSSADEIVMLVEWARDLADISHCRSPSILDRLVNEIETQIKRRSDANWLGVWLESGLRPPLDLFAQSGPAQNDLQRCLTKRGNRPRDKMPLGAKRRSGTFNQHVTRESNVVRLLETQRTEHKAMHIRHLPLEEEIAFVEKVGQRQLFSIREAERLFREAEPRFGKENKVAIINHLKKLVEAGDRRDLAKAPNLDALAAIRAKFPHAGELMDHVERAAALARLDPQGYFSMPPLLIYGEPGIGKTAIAQELARVLAVPFKRFDIGAMSMGGDLFGLSFGWSTGHVGGIYNLLSESQVMNPVAVLDEIDKAGKISNQPVVPGLLTLLEAETSRTYKDEALPIGLDASCVVWFATANDLANISAPLRSRFIEVGIERPKGAHSIAVARSIYRAIRAEAIWGRFFPSEISDSLAEQLAHLVPREMKRVLLAALGEAARAGRLEILDRDLLLRPNRKIRAGFI